MSIPIVSVSLLPKIIPAVRKVFVASAESDIVETGFGCFLAAIAAVLVALRGSSGNVTHGSDSTLSQAGICPAHGDKLT